MLIPFLTPPILDSDESKIKAWMSKIKKIELFKNIQV